MRLLFLCLLSVLYGICFAQKQDSDDRKKNDFSPVEFYFDMGWVATKSKPGGQLDYIISVDYTPGVRYVLPISPLVRGLAEFSYHNVHYHLHQDENKQLPDTILNSRERFYVHVLNLGLMTRIKSKDVGKSVFFDVGINGDYNFRTVHMVKNPDSDGVERKTFDDNINYFEKYNLDVLFRVGIKKWTLHYSHRLTPLLKPEFGLPRLPVGILGIGLSIGSNSIIKKSGSKS